MGDCPRRPSPLGRHNPRLAELRRIGRGESRDLTIVDGYKLVLDLARAGVSIREIYTTAAHHDALAAWLETCEPGRRPTLTLIDEDAAVRVAPSQHGQGVLAVVRRPLRVLDPRGVVLFLDHVQDPGNVGAVIRSAAALGASGVACSPGCADPFSPRAVRAAAGQSLLLPVADGVPFGQLADRFEAASGTVAATWARGGTPLPEWQPRRPVLIALGNEGRGLSPEIESRCSESVSIPLAAGVESLNIAVAAALVLASLAGLVPSPILESSGGGWDDPSS